MPNKTTMAEAWRVIVLSSLVAASAGCQPAHTDEMLLPSVPQIAIARTTCVDVMGIKEGFVPHEACVESLARSLMMRAGSPTASTAQTGGGKNYSGAATAKPYSESTTRERRANEEYSCGRIGFVPGTPGFTSCITDLDASLRSEQRSE